MKYCYIFSLLFVVSCSSLDQINPLFTLNKPLFGVDNSKEEYLLKDAALSAKQGDYKRASNVYKELVNLSPHDINYLLGVSDNLRLSRKCDEALNYYDKVIALSLAKTNEVLLAKEGKGLCYMQQGMFDVALDFFKEVISEDASRWRVINAIGVIFSLTNHDQEAIEYYNLALSVETHYVTLNNLALIQALNNKTSDAINNFNKALTFVDNNIAAKKSITLNLALVYAMSGQIDQAETILKPLLTESQISHNISIYKKLAHNRELAKGYIDQALKP